MKIGRNLQEIIKHKEVDPEAVREALGWDQDTLDKVLNDDLSPGVSELLRLANLLGVDISTIIHGKEYTERKAIKTTKSERVGVKRKGYLRYESLAPSFVGRHLEPFVVDIFPDKEEELDVSRHQGEEFIYVLSGHLRIMVNDEKYELEPGASFYFYSYLPHSIQSLTEHSRIVAALYNSGCMLNQTKGHGMKALIGAAKLLERRNVVLVCPDKISLNAVNKTIEERLVDKAFLVGRIDRIKELCAGELLFPKNYEFVDVAADGDAFEPEAARVGVALVRDGQGAMLMKGSINTVHFIKAVLKKDTGIALGRRLSIVCVFEIPGVDRLIFLTDPGINPELFVHEDVESGVDIISNAIDAARGLGVERPKVALLEANEVPSSSLPTTMLERKLSERAWANADVYGPLSYDLALYPYAAEKKGIKDNPVAGKADILVVPSISGGNFLYKTWVFTMGAEVANVVIGAKVPIIMTSRSDSEITKFLTMCASVLYSHFLLQKTAGEPSFSLEGRPRVGG
ncbi:MAG: cupin domain-containing protein [Deltaproteobacteria bacterium]|nr:cupin domain-containing protein [Deltaproteobacteria bacterium]